MKIKEHNAKKKMTVKEEIINEVKRYRQMRMTMWYARLLGCSRSNNKKEIYIIIDLPHKTIEIPSKQLNIAYLKIEKEQMQPNTTERKLERIKLNEIENKISIKRLIQ